jgi:hypothetical protein
VNFIVGWSSPRSNNNINDDVKGLMGLRCADSQWWRQESITMYSITMYMWMLAGVGEK